MPIPKSKKAAAKSKAAAPAKKAAPAPVAKKASAAPISALAKKKAAAAPAPAKASKKAAAPVADDDEDEATAAAPTRGGAKAEKPAKREYRVSPKGTAVWPKLTTPDEKYNRLGTKLALPADSKAAEKFVAAIDEQMELSMAAALEADTRSAKMQAKAPITAAAAPYALELDEDGEETGNILFNFSRMAEGVAKKTGKKWHAKVKHFDSVGRVLDDVEVGSGSTIAVSFTWYLYCVKGEAGVSMRPESVMVYDLVEWAGGPSTAEGYGFETEEDEDGAETEAEDGDDDDAGSDEDDF